MQILYNAKIHTLNPEQPIASGLAIENERILAVGSDYQILSEFAARPAADRPAFRDLGGLSVMPGLTDAHIHLENTALWLEKVDCETPTRAGCIQRVAERCQTTPPGAWVLGHGWNQNEWAEGFGNVTQLDRVALDHPVYLTAKSLHAGWANTRAMHLAGLTDQTPDPPGGRLGRDESGKLTGILFETAMDLVSQVIPAPSVETVAQAIRAAIPRLWRVGVTGVHDFDRSRCLAALQALQMEGDLKLRVVKSIPLEDLPRAVELGLRSGFGNDTLRIGSVKVFADGALGPRTAAMLQPFENEPANRGILMMDAEELFEHGRLAVENGFSLAVHAIGDRANHEVLDAFAHIRPFEAGKRPFRHRIEHVQLIHADDAPRLAALGVIASMQPIHATSDMLMADRYWGERSSLAYAWRTQMDSGAVLAFGSDAPVENPNPFWGLHAAVTRRRLDGSPGPDGWYPAQRLEITEAIRAYTSGAAYAAGMEDRLGMLAPGYLADLLVLETDPFTCLPEEIRDIHPLATMVGGEWVWEA